MLTGTLMQVALWSPFFCALLAMSFRRGGYRIAVLVIPFITLVSVALLLLRFTLYDESVTLTIAQPVPGLVLGFKTEILGLIFATVVAVLWPVSMLYSLSYCETASLKHQPRFFACFSLAVGSTLGIAFAGDLLTLWIFYEALTLSTYPLVVHYGDDKSRVGGRLYLGFLLGTSILLFLPAMIWIQSTCGTLSFTSGGILQGCVSNKAASWLLLMLIFGIGKAALMPLHRWLPEAMVAPAPVSALLHAVAVVKAGVFTIVKVVVYVFGFEFMSVITSGWLVYVAGASIIMASLIALRQDVLKKMLAYSTVSQLSYITLGVALFKPAFFGAVLHLVTHAFGKIALFFVAGAIQSVAGKVKISDFKGLAYSMPWTMACFTIAALSMIGLPPLAGFVGKWFLLEGAVDAGHYFAIGVLLLGTVLNAGYFLPVIYRAYTRTGENTDATEQGQEAPAPMLLAISLPVLAVLVLFFYADDIVRLIERVG